MTDDGNGDGEEEKIVSSVDTLRVPDSTSNPAAVIRMLKQSEIFRNVVRDIWVVMIACEGWSGTVSRGVASPTIANMMMIVIIIIE